MTESQKKTAPINKNPPASDEPQSRTGKIDRNAPAGSEDSLGAESVRDGRPATDDTIVEAMDEQGSAIADLDDK